MIEKFKKEPIIGVLTTRRKVHNNDTNSHFNIRFHRQTDRQIKVESIMIQIWLVYLILGFKPYLMIIQVYFD